MTAFHTDITPADLGLPSQFRSFRPAQLEAIEYARQCQRKFTALGLPTGSGKSLLAWAIARVIGASRTVYLTGTRGLQDQINREFEVMGVRDVRGRRNYACWEGNTCEEGHREGCELQSDKPDETECLYQLALNRGRNSRLSITNYAMWFAERKYNAWPAPDLLICDEAGEIPDLLADAVAIHISGPGGAAPHYGCEFPHTWRKGYKNPSGLMPDADWREWAIGIARSVKDRMEAVKKRYRSATAAMRDEEYLSLSELYDKLTTIAGLQANWVWEVDEHGVSFDPISVAPYSGLLWSGIPRVLLLSATLRTYLLELLGLKPDEYDFREWPGVFPPQLSPVYVLPTVKLTWKSDETDYRTIVSKADEIMAGRRDRKGIIQTVSHDRAERVLGCSEFVSRFVSKRPGESIQAVYERYRNGRNDSVLVSPSFATGYDFPGTGCEFQIFLKTPYSNTTRRVVAERCNDQKYRMYSATQSIVQMAGRGVRSNTDRCETFILDSGVKWVMGSRSNPWHGFAPKAFYSKVWTIDKIPPAPPKL